MYECTAVIYVFTYLQLKVFTWDRRKMFFSSHVTQPEAATV